MASIYRLLQKSAHEQPIVFYSLLIGAVGPTIAIAVPPIRRNYFGYKSPEPIPTSFPDPVDQLPDTKTHERIATMH